MKIVTIIGARPQFIKAATLSRAVAGNDNVTEIILHTGQHYDQSMSDIFFEQMNIPRPDYHLGIGGGRHGAMTGQQLVKIEEVLLKEKPDWVLVYGDTNSTLAGALAAAKLHIPVVHVEAGLRSFNRKMPEEINRVLTDHISTVLFAPTETARANLLAEGIADDKIHVVGDVMYDAALFYKDRATRPEWFADLKLNISDFVLCTIHRAENTDDPDRLRSIFIGLGNAGLQVVLPLHPRTRVKLAEYQIALPANVHIAEPVGYLEMVWLEANCKVVATDSGGMQKEAYFHCKPCVTLREETEWVELVECGAAVLVGSDPIAIANAVSHVQKLERYDCLYGVGTTASTVVDGILRNFLADGGEA